MRELKDVTTRFCYIAKNKENGMLHKGLRNHVGFSNIGDLKRSITYLWKCEEVPKPHDLFDFYRIDSSKMDIEKL